MTDIVISTERILDQWFDQYTWSSICYPKGLTPNDYLKFARLDLLDGNFNRNLINAASNAKRALHLEVETISHAFGADACVKKIKNFPQRLAFLVKCGIIGPTILTKLNTLRNSIEHDYYVPTLDEIENFIDIVSLFVESTKFYRLRYPCDVELYDALDDNEEFRIHSVCASLEEGNLRLKIAPQGRPRDFFYKDISVNDEKYFIWLPFILRNNS